MTDNEREFREGFIAGYMEAGGSHASAQQAYHDFVRPGAARHSIKASEWMKKPSVGH